MSTKFLSFLMLLTVAINYAQITTSPAGIAIQGIARDNNNTAKTSASITLLCTIYEQGSLSNPIFLVRKTVTTDAFGVFSIVLEPGAANNVVIANKDAFLQIVDESTGTSIIISDEKLKQVPYAIAASNGVPTGSIMPYIGTTAPAGWVMCDGSALPTNGSAAALITLVGNSAPNLQGMFLRGTGTSPVNNQAGPALKSTQDDGFEKHLHDATHKHTITDPGHFHDIGMRLRGNEDGDNEWTLANEPDSDFPTKNEKTGISINDFTGNTAEAGTLLETRPVNYGVNYIIKL